MEKYAVYGEESEPERTSFEYEVGEFITVNSTIKTMCKHKEIKDGKLIQYFRAGRLVFD